MPRKVNAVNKHIGIASINMRNVRGESPEISEDADFHPGSGKSPLSVGDRLSVPKENRPLAKRAYPLRAPKHLRLVVVQH